MTVCTRVVDRRKGLKSQLKYTVAQMLHSNDPMYGKVERADIFEMKLRQHGESVFVRCKGCRPTGWFIWRDHLSTCDKFNVRQSIHGWPTVGGYGSCQMWIEPADESIDPISYTRRSRGAFDRFKRFTHLMPLKVEVSSRQVEADIVNAWEAATETRLLFGTTRLCKQQQQQPNYEYDKGDPVLYEEVTDPRHPFLNRTWS